MVSAIPPIPFQTCKIIDSFFNTYYASEKNKGTEFYQIREFQPGDDVRTIDWKTSLKYGKLTPNFFYIRQKIKERNFQIYIVFDMSNSFTFGSEYTKIEKGIEVSNIILDSAVRLNIPFGAIFFNDGIKHKIPVSTGSLHKECILNWMLDFQPKIKPGSFEKIWADLYLKIEKPSLIFLVSDFQNFSENGFLHTIKSKHDIIAIQLIDPVEEKFPDVGFIQLEDLESGEQLLINSSNKYGREKYDEIIQEQKALVDKMFAPNLIHLKTSETDFYSTLNNFFLKRKGDAY
mgnify:FL=1